MSSAFLALIVVNFALIVVNFVLGDVYWWGRRPFPNNQGVSAGAAQFAGGPGQSR